MGSESMTAEVEYRDIPGHPGYRAGGDGSIWSCWTRKGEGWRFGTKAIMGSAWRLLRPYVTERGYLRYTLVVDGKKRLVFGHTLVLEAFVGPCPPGLEACHDPNRDPADNRAENLRWGTHSENERDKRKHGTNARGSKTSSAVLDEATVVEVRQRSAAGETAVSLAAEKGVGESAVRSIIKRRTWVHV